MAYIELEKVLEIAKDEYYSDFHKSMADLTSLRELLEDTPTADVVEVVRCENCKHLTIHNSPTLYAYCEKTQYRFEPFKTDTRTHFCGFCELKEREGK